MRSVRITVDLNALQSNLLFAKSLSASSNSKVFAVIKANAYGHGAVECAKALEPLADGFAVVASSEAFQLVDAGITCPILLMQGAQTDCELIESVEKELLLGVHSDYQIDAIQRLAHQFHKPLSVWLKLDSGMGRLGFRLESLERCLSKLNDVHGVNVVGCFSHFSCADDVNPAFTVLQIHDFKKTVIGKEFNLSLANSAGVLTQPESHLDWVRPGIMLYGANPLWPRAVAELRPVMTVKAPLISIRDMRAGETIGYGNTYCCKERMTVGVLAIGYGDGYPRHIEPGAAVLFDGHRCMILGRVSMDSIIIDLTDIKLPKIGEFATIWGGALPVEELADKAGTLSYELLCQIRGSMEYI